MAQKRRIRIAVVEDEYLVARMLCAWLGQHRRFELIGHATDGEQGRALCLQTRPEVVLLDIMMPKMDGLTLAGHLRRELPDLKIIILSARLEPYVLYRLQQLDIHGCVDKSCTPDRVTQTILSVMEGKDSWSPNYANAWHQLRTDSKAFFKILSDREIEVLRLLVQGKDLSTIATQLQITYQTARTHQRNIRRKLGAHSAVEVLRHAQKTGVF